MTIESSKEYLEGLFNGQSLIPPPPPPPRLNLPKHDLDKVINELLEHLFRTCMRSKTGDYQNIISFINEYNEKRCENGL